VHYTVGQRRGLGVASPEPVYVLRVDAARNRVVVGPRSRAGTDTMPVRELNWVSCDSPVAPFTAAVAVRYRAAPVPARITPSGDGRATVSFLEARPVASPGQSAVFYDGETVLGGGVIDGNREAGKTESSLP
jgi:tRNA-specific 2-thiouridylase